jgi:ferredoxin
MTVDPAASAATASADPAMADRPLLVWIDQDLCTGDGLCVQYARSVFEMDLDGLAYVKDSGDDLMTDPGARTPVPSDLVADVIASARECPGACIHVERADDGVEIVGPNAISDAAIPKG